MSWLLLALVVWFVAALAMGAHWRRVEVRQARQYAEMVRLMDATFPEFMRTGRYEG